ncbi:MAG: DNA-binding domain-containing protein [Oceanobacter sp.]
MADHLELQRHLASYLKEPETVTAPAGLSSARLSVYEELMFNNIKGFLDSGFPVAAEIIGEENWHRLARQFWSEHSFQSPYFLHISREFRQWLASAQIRVEVPVYLNELVHYEWLELELDVRPVIEPESESVTTSLDWLQRIPCLTLASEGCLYPYPVHLLSAENANPEPQETSLIVYRNTDDEVQFVQTNPLTLALFERLKAAQHRALEVLSGLLTEQGLPVNQDTIGFGLGILDDWYRIGLIRGLVPEPEPALSS